MDSFNKFQKIIKRDIVTDALYVLKNSENYSKKNITERIILENIITYNFLNKFCESFSVNKNMYRWLNLTIYFELFYIVDKNIFFIDYMYTDENVRLYGDNICAVYNPSKVKEYWDWLKVLRYIKRIQYRWKKIINKKRWNNTVKLCLTIASKYLYNL